MNKMLIKIFMSRKNTKIYFIVVLFISLLFISVHCLNYYYIQKNNNNFNESYIFVNEMSSFKKNIKKIGVSKLIKVKKNIENDTDLFYKIENTISEKKVLVSNNSYKNLINNNAFNNIKIDICSKCADNIIYINQALFDKLSIKNIDGYYMTLSDWSEIDSVINFFKEQEVFIDIRYSETYNVHVMGITKLLKTFLLVIKYLIVILYMVIFVDIILDCKNKYNLLYVLGLNFYKIIALIIIQFIFYIIEFLLIYRIFMFIYSIL